LVRARVHHGSQDPIEMQLWKCNGFETRVKWWFAPVIGVV
jgi:hypothetical protein